MNIYGDRQDGRQKRKVQPGYAEVGKDGAEDIGEKIMENSIKERSQKELCMMETFTV